MTQIAKLAAICLISVLVSVEPVCAAFTLANSVSEGLESGATADAPSTNYAIGNQLVAFVYWDHASVTLNSVVYDPGGANETALTAVGAQLNTGISQTKLHIYRLCNIPTSGSKVVRATWSGALSGSGALKIFEVSGGDTSACVDAENQATGNSAGPAVTTITTTTANAAIFAFVASNQSEPTADTGYTQVTLIDVGFWVDGQYDLDVGSSGAKTVQMTHGGSGAWAVKAVALKLSAAVGKIKHRVQSQ